MEIGLALPLDASWSVVVGCARRAESLGMSSVWLFEHGAPATPRLEPLTALAGLSRATAGVRLGAFLDVSRRPPAVVAKALATTDLLSGGRITTGMGAGPAATPPEAAERLGEAAQVVRGAFAGGPFTFEGRHHRVSGLRCRPLPLQRPAPPVWLGGGPAVFGVVARHGDGWAAPGWSGPVDHHLALAAELDRACEEAGRDPAGVSRSVCRSLLVGESGPDLQRRWEQAARSPPGAPGPSNLEEYRRGRLVGTPGQVGEQVAAWAAAGVATIIVDPWALPLSVTSGDDLDLVASAVSSVR